MEHYQVAIIGGGPGGYETAIRLNQYGISVICFEKERLGGVCLNKGCIPTKALVKVADLYHEMRNAAEFGLTNAEFDIDYTKISQRKNAVVEKLVGGIEFLFNKRQIPVIKKAVNKISLAPPVKAGTPDSAPPVKAGGGRGGATDAIYTIYTDDQDLPLLTADHIIIATGSIPKELPFLPFDGEQILSSDHILNMTTLPKSLTIIGGGVIGCEFACIFKQLGVEVNIVEFLPEIVPTEDEEISKRLAMALKKMGIKVYTKAKVESRKAKVESEDVELTLSNGKTISSEKVLVAVGRTPVFDIETVGFEIITNNGYIEIDDYCRCLEPNTEHRTPNTAFAIGDITGKLMLAHTASKQGLLVADYLNHKINNISMHLKPIAYQNIPSCIFTTPEVASCGVTEAQAKEKYENNSTLKVGKFPYQANGKALASGATTGFVKTIIDAETDQIIGMHIIGLLATELIAQASILINTKATVHDVANIIFAHPTISECIMESIEDINGLAINK